MNLYAWIGLGVFALLTVLPLMKVENRSRENIWKASLTIIVVIGIIFSVLLLGVNYMVAVLVGFFLLILLDKKTYTLRRIIPYGMFILVVSGAGYYFLRANPTYVLEFLKNNPDSASLYYMKNNEESVLYNEDAVRPLASTVKIIIAAEYAVQVDEGKIDKTQPVSLDELEQHHFKDTDGGAHPAWLESIKEAGIVEGNQVKLHDVAKGMITYSSNANTDFLINLLGGESINKRMQALGLIKHESIYPIVGALAISDYLRKDQSEKQLIQEIRSLSDEEYRSISFDISEKLKQGSYQFGEVNDLSMDIQRVWSDRLIGAAAADYGKLMALISEDALPGEAAEIMRDLMEWPMTVNEDNQERFAYLGFKGGSTAVVRTHAYYAETLKGDQYEIILFFDDLSWWEGIRLDRSLNEFVSKLMEDEEFQKEVKREFK